MKAPKDSMLKRIGMFLKDSILPLILLYAAGWMSILGYIWIRMIVEFPSDTFWSWVTDIMMSIGFVAPTLLLLYLFGYLEFQFIKVLFRK